MTAAAAVYGNALYDLALEENTAELYYEQLGVLRAQISESPDLLKLLSTRALSLGERKAVVDRCFSAFAPYLRNWLKILCEKNLAHHLPESIRQYELRYFEDHGIVEVTAVTAVAMTEQQKSALAKTLAEKTGKQPRITCKVDPAVLGGVRLEWSGQELDGTVRGKLDRIESELKTLIL